MSTREYSGIERNHINEGDWVKEYFDDMTDEAIQIVRAILGISDTVSLSSKERYEKARAHVERR